MHRKEREKQSNIDAKLSLYYLCHWEKPLGFGRSICGAIHFRPSLPVLSSGPFSCKPTRLSQEGGPGWRWRCPSCLGSMHRVRFAACISSPQFILGILVHDGPGLKRAHVPRGYGSTLSFGSTATRAGGSGSAPLPAQNTPGIRWYPLSNREIKRQKLRHSKNENEHSESKMWVCFSPL